MANLSGFTGVFFSPVIRTANSKDVIPLSKICENCDVNIHPSSLCGVMKTILDSMGSTAGVAPLAIFECGESSSPIKGCPYCNTYIKNHIRWQELMQADIKFWQEYRESYV